MRGRSLLWLSLFMGAGAAASYAASEARWGPATFRVAWPMLLGTAVAALVVWSFFLAAHTFLQRRHPGSARSLVHLQTIASAIVAIIAIIALMGGFQTVIVGLGLVGFGLTLALQRPILSVAGWGVLVFGGSVRVGDRIRVGDLAGDVLDISLFSTRLWEVGEASSATPNRPTGRMVTVSNAVFLEKPVANATSDTPVIFDEFVVNVAFESDLQLAEELLRQAGQQVLQADHHARMATTYRRLTKGLAMEADFPDQPIVLAESKPSWMEYRLRYLVDARRAGRTQSALTKAWTDLTTGEADIPQVYPRSQPQAIGPDGRAR